MKRYILMSLLLFDAMLLMANKQQYSEVTPKCVQIYGHLEKDTNHPSMSDSIEVYFGWEIPDSKIGAFRTFIKVNDQNKFSIILPSIEAPTRLSLFFPGFRDGHLNEYIAEPDDSIYIVIKKRNSDLYFAFSGRGSAKYECKREIDSKGFTRKNGDGIRKAIDADGIASVLSRYERTEEVTDSIIAIQIKSLRYCENQLSPMIYQIMRADIIGHANIFIKDLLWDTRTLTNDKDEVLRSCQKIIKGVDKYDIPQSIQAMSSSYLMYLSAVNMSKLIVENRGNEDYSFENVRAKKFNDICSKIQSDYSGILEERLLLFELQNPHVQDTYGFEQCLNRTYDLIQTPSLKKIINNWYRNKLRGSKAYNFSLPDTSCYLTNLVDFFGKVVYIDIWFTGCTGCAMLAKEVDNNVYPIFKDNPNVVFVSISADKNRSQWMKSVRTEKYGLKTYVNLFTGGMGFMHPFMRFYDVQGGPTTLLIDKKGNIYSSTPPKHGKSSELISLIEQAIMKVN